MKRSRMVTSFIRNLYVFLVLDLIATAFFAYQTAYIQANIDRAHRVIEELNATSSTFQRIESSVRGYLNTGNRTMLKPFFRSGPLMDLHEDELTALLSNPADHQPLQLAELKETIRQKLEWQEQVILAYEQNGLEQAIHLSRTNRGVELMNDFHRQVHDIVGAEHVILTGSINDLRDAKARLASAIAALGLLAVGLIWNLASSNRESRKLSEQRNAAFEQLEMLNKELNRQNAELLEAQHQANKAIAVHNEFLANVSHELRTPLAGVMGATELVLDTPLDAEQRDLIETANHSGAMLLNLVNDILDFQQLQSMAFALRLADFELRPFVESALEPLKMKAQKKGLEFLTEISESVPVTVRGDQMRIEQVLINLVDNSVKYTDQGKVSVRLGIQPNSAGQDHCLLFIVSDTGIGIRDEDLTSIFDSFMQVDGSTTRKHGGIGLGLSISKRLVQLMGGEILVSSVLGTGSQFSFTVPMELSDCRAPQTPSPANASIASACKSKSILVVDDNVSISRITALQLKKLDYLVATVSSGEKAIEETRKNFYLAILMDVQMSGIDGLSATRQIRSDEFNLCRTVPIIALTAHAMAEDRERCLKAGMNDYMSKPVSLQELQSILEKWIPPLLIKNAHHESTCIPQSQE